MTKNNNKLFRKALHLVCFAAALAFPVTACSTAAQVEQQTVAANYGAATPIRFKAVKIEVVSEYQPRGSAPSIDHMMTKSPSDAVVEWAKGRLRANGSSGYIQIRIKDASVTTRMLDVGQGLSSYFTRENAEELVGHLEVDISGDQRDAAFNGYTTISASQLLTVPENATTAERQAIEADLINKLMIEFNQKAEAGINTHLSQMLVQQ